MGKFQAVKDDIIVKLVIITQPQKTQIEIKRATVMDEESKVFLVFIIHI